jgi:hypothetical protein
MAIGDILIYILAVLLIVGEGFSSALAIRHDLVAQRETQRLTAGMELLVADVLAASPQLEETVGIELEEIRAFNRRAAALLAAFGKFENRKWVNPVTYWRFLNARHKVAQAVN